MASDDADSSSQSSETSESDTALTRQHGIRARLRDVCEFCTLPLGRCMGSCFHGTYSPALPGDGPLGSREDLLYHLGKLARLVYGNGFIDDEYFGKVDAPFNGEGWAVVDQIVQAAFSGNAIQAACYLPTKLSAKAAVVAFRGTNTRKGMKQCVDLRFIRGKLICEAVAEACNFYRKSQASYPERTVYVTGHSLGGYIAEAVASLCDAPGACFNSPGPWHSTRCRNHTGHHRPTFEIHLTRDDPLALLLFPKPENSSHIGLPIWHPGRSHRKCKPYMRKIEEMRDVEPNMLPLDCSSSKVVDQLELLREMAEADDARDCC